MDCWHPGRGGERDGLGGRAARAEAAEQEAKFRVRSPGVRQGTRVPLARKTFSVPTPMLSRLCMLALSLPTLGSTDSITISASGFITFTSDITFDPLNSGVYAFDAPMQADWCTSSSRSPSLPPPCWSRAASPVSRRGDGR